MIRQVSSVVRFEDAQRVEVLLQAPSVPQTTLVLRVNMVGRSYPLRVSDDASGRPRWRMPNDTMGGCARFYRIPGPVGGVGVISIETEGGKQISGTAVAAEVAGVSAGDAVQALDDLLGAT